MKKYRFLLVIAFLAILAVGCRAAQEEATPTPIPTPIVAEKQTYTVQRGLVQRYLTFSARVSPVVEHELFFRINGNVKKVYVERNQLVRAGDILAELDIEGTLNQLAQVQVNLEKAELALQQAIDANTRQIEEFKANLLIKELRLEKARLQSPKASVEKARLKMEEAKQKLEELQQPASELELAQAKLAVLQAETSLQEAREELAKVKAGPTPAQLASAEAALKAAEEKYKMLLAGADLEAIEQARLRLEQARNSLWAAQASRDAACGRAEAGTGPREACDSAQASVANAEIAVQLAEISYKQAQEPPSPADIAKAAAEVEKLKEALEELRKSPTPLALAKAETRVSQAEYNLLAAREKLAELEAEASETEKALAEAKLAALRAATINYELAKADYESALQSLQAYELDLQIMERDLEISRQQLAWLEQGVDPKLEKAVEQARLDVERLQDQVNRGRLISPIDGVVTSLAVYEGRDVQAFKPVAIVADYSDLELTAQLGDSELTWLKVDMPVTVTLSTYPGVLLRGKITDLPYPYGRGGSSEKLDKADLFTHIKLDEPNVKLTPGDSAKVSVLLEQSFDTLWLPPAAIRTFEGRNFVVIETEGRQRRIDIKVGVKGEDRVEILEGLQEGQIVISQ